jgi:hypothetical protein
MEKINTFLSALLKLVTVTCIVFATFYYCQNAGNGRFHSNNDDGTSVFDNATGITKIIDESTSPVLKSPWRVTTNPFSKKMNDVFVYEENKMK